MMYDFKFHPEAEKELGKLNKSVQILFTKALKKILIKRFFISKQLIIGFSRRVGLPTMK